MPIRKCWHVISAASTIAVMAAASPAFGAAETPLPVPPLDEASCAHQPVMPVFAAFGDLNLYTLAPGGAFTDTGGWQLAGGASVAAAAQPDGSVGGVLDLPGKSQATSPVMCITTDYPTARVWVRNAADDEDLRFNVQYWDKEKLEWTKPKESGKFKADKAGGWNLSKELDVKPDKDDPGWQQVRFTLHVNGSAEKNRVQVDNLWIDPRASR